MTTAIYTAPPRWVALARVAASTVVEPYLRLTHNSELNCTRGDEFKRLALRRKHMKCGMESMTDWMLTGLLTVLLIGVSMFPSRAEAQKGKNAVYKDASTCCKATPAFIDASVFAGNFTSPNLCLVLNYVLVNVIQVFYPGGGGWTSRPIFRSGYRERDAPPVAVSRVGRDDDGDQKILRIRSSALRVSLTRTGPRSPNGCTPERVCPGTSLGAKFAPQPMGEGLFQGGQSRGSIRAPRGAA